MEGPNKKTPEEIAGIEKSRTVSDAELLNNGAEYTLDESGQARLRITVEQMEDMIVTVQGRATSFESRNKYFEIVGRHKTLLDTGVGHDGYGKIEIRAGIDFDTKKTVEYIRDMVAREDIDRKKAVEAFKIAKEKYEKEKLTYPEDDLDGIVIDGFCFPSNDTFPEPKYPPKSVEVYLVGLDGTVRWDVTITTETVDEEVLKKWFTNTSKKWSEFGATSKVVLCSYGRLATPREFYNLAAKLVLEGKATWGTTFRPDQFELTTLLLKDGGDWKLTDEEQQAVAKRA